MKKIMLNNEIMMPVFGVEIKNMGEGSVYNIIRWAIKMESRCFECSCCEKIEKEVGFGIKDAIKEDKLKREELFVIGKFYEKDNELTRVKEVCENSLKNLGLEYFDLYLLKNKDNQDKGEDEKKGVLTEEKLQKYWKEMEEIYENGLCKAIGVENFGIKDCEKIEKIAEINPMVDKIKRNPYRQEKELVEWGEKNNVVIAGYEIFGKDDEVLENEEIGKIAAKNKVSKRGVCVSWSVCHGGVVLQKISHIEHLRECLEGLNCLLYKDELAKIDML